MKIPNFRNRPVFLALLSAVFALTLVCRLFYLQILHGADYTQSFEESVTRKVSIPSKRGRILDRNGKVLAESVAVRNITIVDNTGNTREENSRLNRIIQKTLQIMSENGEELAGDFGISWDGSGYVYTCSGAEKLRFLADLYGYPLTDTLTEEEKNSSAEDMVLMLADRYRVEKDMTSSAQSVMLLNTVITRYRLSLNAFQKYLPTKMAVAVSDETVAAVMAESDLDGISISTDYQRVYTDSIYMSAVTGYISQISSEQLEENSDLYSAGDSIGTVGIEASMEDVLKGRNGYREISVDNLGREQSELSYVRPQDGNDVYLTIDADLQRNAYRILEKNIRDIILSKLTDSVTSFEITEDTDGSDILIPAADAYAAILNYVVDRDHFYADDASESELMMKGIFEAFLEGVREGIRSELTSGGTPYADLSAEYREYASYIVRALYDRGVLDAGLVDDGDEIYRDWTISGTASMRDFLYHAAASGWLDRELLGTSSDDTDEIYSALTDYILDEPCSDYSFGNIVCKYICESGAASGEMVCRILIDQGITAPSESVREGLESGRYGTAFQYVRRLISTGELTPGQLNLYPFSGSIVVTDPSDGRVLALVSYPGYDCGRIQERGYISGLAADPSRPMLNHSTQQRTAPGSTYKMVTAAAGISEGVIDAEETINCSGRFDKIDPSPACWLYPSGHGWQNLRGAIANSCNMYFYEVGYRLGELDGEFDNDTGLEALAKYAGMYGLDRKSGVEIEEADPSVATRDVVRASIGQANNGYTTAALARYVAAVAARGDVYDLTLLDHAESPDGSTAEEYPSKSAGTASFSEDYWDSVTEGMRRVCASNSAFSSLQRTGDDGSSERIEAAGKTGTAQQASNMPNHALFLGYAPSEDPEIAIAVRIPNGYSSSYAARAAAQIMQYYFDPDSLSGILTAEDIPNYENGD